MQVTPRREAWLLACVTLVLGLLTLFPMLGKFGLWDPHEINLAEQARKLAAEGNWQNVWHSQPPLTLWLIGLGTHVFGPSEIAARLPFAILGLVSALATYAIGARLRRPRAGLYAAMVLLGSPLFVFQSRQLMTDLGAVAGSSLAILGLLGLVWPRAARAWYVIAGDALLTLVGLALGLLAGGLFLGVLIPIGAVAVAQIVAAAGRFGSDEDPAVRPRGQLALAVVLGALALGALVAVLGSVYHLKDGSVVVSARYVPLVGGQWRSGEPAAAFDYVINQVAFGMFPWSALAPIAVLRLVVVKRRDRAAWSGLVVVSWALVAYLVTSVWARRVGDVRFPALGAIALAVGLLVDDVLRAKLENDSRHAPEARDGLPVAALFVLIAGFILSLDCLWFPDELGSVHLAGRNIKFPTEVKLLPFNVAFGCAFAALMAVGLYFDAERPPFGVPARRVTQAGLWGGLGIGYLFGIFLAMVYTPQLSEHFSYKDLFQSYDAHRHGSEPLAVMGLSGAGPDYYAKGRFQRIEGMPQMLDFLKKPDERVFAIVPSDRLCMMHQENTGRDVPYHVIDTRNSRAWLLSNRLEGDEKDLNPLITAFAKEPPGHFERDVTANFEDTLELLGVDMPAQVTKGERFKVTFWFKVNKQPTLNYKVFVHFDGPGVRFQGDHEPVDGKCGPTAWRPGDIVADHFTVVAGDLAHPPGPYTVWAGFFTGGGGVWKNMVVLSPNHDKDNRVSLGTLVVK